MDEFSDFQIQRLLQRCGLSRKLEDIRTTLNTDCTTAYGLFEASVGEVEGSQSAEHMDLLCIQMLLCLNGAKYTSLLMLIMLEQESFGLKHCAQTRKNQKYPLKKKGRVSIL